METRRISSASIDPPRNRHRVEITEDSITDLAKDIRDRGLMNPITVRPIGERFEVIAGERRYTAMQYLGWPMMECRITADISDEACEALRLAENLQRENLSPWEEAVQITALLEVHNGDYHTAAKACHRSPDWVRQRATLFNVPIELQPLVHTKQLSIGAALALAKIDDQSQREYYTRLAMFDGCTVDVLNRWVNDYLTQRLINPDADPIRPTMPEPGQACVVYLDCNLCDQPADTRTRAPRFICVNCQRIWNDFKEAYATASAAADDATSQAQVPA